MNKDYEDDSVFFHKGQIKFGVELRFIGRTATDHESWKVIRIDTFAIGPNYHGKMKTVKHVYQLKDLIYLQNTKTREVITRQFQNLSYSAIWQLI